MNGTRQDRDDQHNRQKLHKETETIIDDLRAIVARMEAQNDFMAREIERHIQPRPGGAR